MVPNLDPGDAAADHLDDTGAFVTEYHRKRHLHIPGNDEEIAVTETRCHDPHQDLIRPRISKFNVLDDQVGFRFVKDRGFDLHRSPPPE